MLDVIVPQYGQTHLTVELIRSVWPDDSVRFIVVDNGSAPYELAPVRAVLQRGPHRLVELTHNFGFAVAVNVGLEHSETEIVCIQNNDTVMPPGGFARLLEHMHAHPEIGLLGPLADNVDSAQRATAAVPDGGLLFTSPISFFCTLLRRSVLERVGPLCEEFGIGFGEDDDYCIRVRRAGYRVAIARDVFVHHVHHATFRPLVGEAGMDRESQQGLALLKEKYA